MGAFATGVGAFAEGVANLRVWLPAWAPSGSPSRRNDWSTLIKAIDEILAELLGEVDPPPGERQPASDPMR